MSQFRVDEVLPSKSGKAWRVRSGSSWYNAFMDSGIEGHVGKMIEAEIRAAAHRSDAAPPENGDASSEREDDAVEDIVDEAVAAAALLGLDLDASEDEIRAALRAHLTLSRLHPDQGGDAEEAKRLIAAKNYLVERARAAQP